MATETCGVVIHASLERSNAQYAVPVLVVGAISCRGAWPWALGSYATGSLVESHAFGYVEKTNRTFEPRSAKKNDFISVGYRYAQNLGGQ